MLNEHGTKPSVFPRWCYSTENGDNISGHEIYRNLRPVLFSLPTSALSSEMNLRSVAGCNGPLTLSSLMKPIRWILVGRKRQSKGVYAPTEKIPRRLRSSQGNYLSNDVAEPHFFAPLFSSLTPSHDGINPSVERIPSRNPHHSTQPLKFHDEWNLCLSCSREFAARKWSTGSRAAAFDFHVY